MKIKHRHHKGIAFKKSTRRVQTSHAPGVGIVPFTYPLAWTTQYAGPPHFSEGSPGEEIGESAGVEAAETAAGVL